MADKITLEEMTRAAIPIAQGMLIALRNKTDNPLIGIYVLELARSMLHHNCREGMDPEMFARFDAEYTKLKEVVTNYEQAVSIAGVGNANRKSWAKA